MFLVDIKYYWGTVSMVSEGRVNKFYIGFLSWDQVQLAGDMLSEKFKASTDACGLCVNGWFNFLYEQCFGDR